MFPNASREEVKRSLVGHQTDHLAHAANNLLELEKSRPPPPPPPPPTSTKPTQDLVSQSPSPPPIEKGPSSQLTGKPHRSIFNSIRDTIRRPESASPPSGGLRPNDVIQRQKDAHQDKAITPQTDIKANVEKAVNASRGNRASTIVSNQQVSNVKEAQEGESRAVEIVFSSSILTPYTLFPRLLFGRRCKDGPRFRRRPQASKWQDAVLRRPRSAQGPGVPRRPSRSSFSVRLRHHLASLHGLQARPIIPPHVLRHSRTAHCLQCALSPSYPVF